MPTALSTDQRQMCTNQSSQRQMTKNKIVLHYFKPWNLSDFCVVYLWVVQNQKLQLFYIILLLQPKSNLGSYSTSATRRVRHSQTNSMQNMLNYLPSLHLQLKLILLTCNKLFRRNGFPMLNIDLPCITLSRAITLQSFKNYSLSPNKMAAFSSGRNFFVWRHDGLWHGPTPWPIKCSQKAWNGP